MQINTPETDSKDLPIVEVSNRDECTDLNTLYRYTIFLTSREYFVYKFRSGKFTFNLTFTSEYGAVGLYHVSLKTEEHGYSDLGGANLFGCAKNLKRILQALKNAGTPVKELRFLHVDNFLALKQIEMIESYLQTQGVENFKNRGENFLITDFLEKTENITDLNSDILELRNYLLSIDIKQKRDEATKSRFNTFLSLIKWAFKENKYLIQENKEARSFSLVFQ